MLRASLGLIAVLVLAPVASASPAPTFTTAFGSSPGKYQSSTVYDDVNHTITTGDAFWGLPPTLPARPGDEVTITFDSGVDSLTAGSLPVTRVDARTFRVRLPADAMLPVDLPADFTATEPGTRFQGHYRVDVRLPAGHVTAQVSTPWTAPLAPALAFADHRETGDPIPPVAPLPDEALPHLLAAAGAPVTIRLDARVKTLAASYAGTPLAVTRSDELTYTALLPAGATFPGRLTVDTDSSIPTIVDGTDWAAMIDGPKAVVKDVPAVVSGLRLKGRRLQATVACAGTCPGVLTLRDGGFRIARVSFAGPGQVKLTISRKAQRYLKRHRAKQLRAVLTTRGQAPKVSRLVLG